MAPPIRRCLHTLPPVLGALVLLSGNAAAQGRHLRAVSEQGMVVTAHPLATWAGVRILEAGGNAADAATAAAFAASVVRPSMNSIGGRNQILLRLPDGTVRGIDGTTQVPPGYDQATAPRAEYGYQTVGIPGALAGLMRLHGEHGSLPLATVLEPAIGYAEDGFRLLAGQAVFHAWSAAQLAESDGARQHYLRPDGSPYRAGELLRQPVLARTFRAIAEGGHDVFYRGSIAEAMARDITAHGGFVTRDALAQYEAVDARIVRGTYRGYELVAMDIPASGAVAIQALHIMEQFDRAEFAEEEWAAVTAQALGLAIPDLFRLGSDTAAARATSKAWAAEQAARVRITSPAGAGESSGTPLPGRPSYTTHLSVADSTGFVVSLTQTIGPAMGAKVVTPELGFPYAVTLGGYLSGELTPGTRARSGITPVLVLEDGVPVLVLGAAGGLRIISAVVQAVSRVIDDGMRLDDALAAPRTHPLFDEAFAMLGIDVEAVADRGWTDAQQRWFAETPWQVEFTEDAGRFGRVHAVRYHPASGQWEGAADPGGEGTAVAPAPAHARPQP